jgi:hypothetical protein
VGIRKVEAKHTSSYGAGCFLILFHFVIQIHMQILVRWQSGFSGCFDANFRVTISTHLLFFQKKKNLGPDLIHLVFFFDLD